MRRAGRIALNVLTVLSLLLCVGTVGLWVRSYLRWEGVEVRVTNRLNAYAASERGALNLGSIRCTWGYWILGEVRTPFTWSTPPNGATVIEARRDGWGQLWFSGYARKERFGNQGGYEQRGVLIPFWFVTALSLMLPAWRGHARHATRGKHGLCPRCHYDLTGNVSGVCPECGTPAAGAA